MSKTNPRRIPCSRADVERAKTQAVQDAIRLAWAIIFTVLLDKEGYGQEGLQRVWHFAEKLSEEVAEGRVSVADLRQVLLEEYGIQLSR